MNERHRESAPTLGSLCLVRTEKNLATRVLRELLAAIVKQEDAPASSMTHMDKAIAILVRATDWRPDDPDMKRAIEDATEHLKFYPLACGEWDNQTPQELRQKEEEMGTMKDVVVRLMNGGEDAVAACHEMMPRWTQAAERLPERGKLFLWAIDIYPSGFVYKLGVLSLDGDEILTPEEVRPHYWVTPKCLWMPIPALPYRETVEATPAPS